MEDNVDAEIVEAVEEVEVARLTPLQERANKVLEESKGKFNIVMVIGLDEHNNIDVNSNLPQYPTMQYMINRAQFELLIHEKNALART